MALPQSPPVTAARSSGARISTATPGKRLLVLSLQILLLAGVVQGRIGSDSAAVAAGTTAETITIWQTVLRRLQGFTTETTTITSKPNHDTKKAQVGFAAPAIPRESVDAGYLNQQTEVPVATSLDKEAQQTQAYRNSNLDIDDLAAHDLDNVEAQIMSALTAVPGDSAAAPAPSRASGLGDTTKAANDSAAQTTPSFSSQTAVPNAIGHQVPVAATTPQVLHAQPVPQPADVQLMSANANVGSGMASPAQSLNMNAGNAGRPKPPSPQQLGQQQEIQTTTEEFGQAQEIRPAPAQPQKLVDGTQSTEEGASPTRSSNGAANQAVVVPPSQLSFAAHTQVPWETLHKKITTHCEMTVHFFDGHAKPPTPREVSSLMFETTRYFTDLLTTNIETADIFVGFTATNVAVLPNLLNDPETTFRCDFDFGVQVVDDAVHRITLQTVHGIIDGADFPRFIQDYIWLSPPLKENQFYQTHGVALQCFDNP